MLCGALALPAAAGATSISFIRGDFAGSGVNPRDAAMTITGGAGENNEIEVSAHLFPPHDPDTAVAQARDLQAAGCDHVIIYQAAPYPIDELRNVARALADAVG